MPTTLVEAPAHAPATSRATSRPKTTTGKAAKEGAGPGRGRGGDGTVGRVTRRMVGRGVPITVLPSGTANNIARSLGLIERPFEELIRGWETRGA